MADLIIAFYIFGALTILSSIFVFLQRKLVHAVFALTMAFASSSMLMLIIGQPFIALLQLLVFVGGLSTYLMVSLANEEKGKRYLRLGIFVPIVIILVVWFFFFAQLAIGASVLGSSNINMTFTAALQQFYPLLYMVVVLLFASALGSVLFIKKFAKLVT